MELRYSVFLFLLFFSAVGLAASERVLDPPGVFELDAYVTIEGSLLPAQGTKEIQLDWLTFRDFDDSTLVQKVVENEVSVFIGDRKVDVFLDPMEDNFRVFQDSAVQSFLVPYPGTGKISYSSRIRIKSQVAFPRFPVSQKPVGFLAPSPLVPSAHPVIRGIARSIPDGTNDFETLANVNSFVHHQLVYEGAFIGSPQPALEVWQTKKASCNGYANLAAAILRAKGFPVRLVLGLASDKSDWSEHAWIEVFSSHGWIALDPTYEEVVSDATHLTLARGNDFTEISDKIGFIEGTPVRLFRSFQVHVQAFSELSSQALVEAVPVLEPADETRALARTVLRNQSDAFVPVFVSLRPSPGLDTNLAAQTIVLPPFSSREMVQDVTKKNPGDWKDNSIEIDSPLFSSKGFVVSIAPTDDPLFQVSMENRGDHAIVHVLFRGPPPSSVRVRAEQKKEVFFLREIIAPPADGFSLELSLVRPSLEPIQLVVESNGQESAHWFYPVNQPVKPDPWRDAWNGVWFLLQQLFPGSV